MKIKFTLTKQHIWQYHWYIWRHRPLTKFAFIFFWPLIIVCVAFVSYYCTGISHVVTALIQSAVTIISLAVLQLVYLAIIVAYKSWRMVKASSTGERGAEIGKFDFCWSSPNSIGYYYHWSYFEEIASEKNAFYFILTGKRALIVPKTAFADTREAETFFLQAREHWEIAKANQRHALTNDEGIWPPPPRIGV